MKNKIANIYNFLPSHIKEEVGFPSSFMFLTTAQERFIIEMYESKNSPKQELIDLIEEMKGLVNEI